MLLRRYWTYAARRAGALASFFSLPSELPRKSMAALDRNRPNPKKSSSVEGADFIYCYLPTAENALLEEGGPKDPAVLKTLRDSELLRRSVFTTPPIFTTP